MRAGFGAPHDLHATHGLPSHGPRVTSPSEWGNTPLVGLVLCSGVSVLCCLLFVGKTKQHREMQLLSKPCSSTKTIVHL